MPTSDYARIIGTVEDVFGRRVSVGYDHDGVSIGDWTFSKEQREDMDRLLFEADQRAAANGERMRQEASDG